MPITAEDLANTFWGGVLRDMWGAAKLPGDVYAGRVDPTSDEGIKRAADLAGLGFTGGMTRAAVAPGVEMALGSGGGRMGRAPHYIGVSDPTARDLYEMQSKGPYGRAHYLTPSRNVAAERAGSSGKVAEVFPSGRIFETTAPPDLMAAQNARLMEGMLPGDRGMVEYLLKGRPSWGAFDALSEELEPQRVASVLSTAGFTGARMPRGEVAMFDPRHVTAGDEATRQWLADMQGYDPSRFYHASLEGFDAFDLGKASTGANTDIMGLDKEQAAFLVKHYPEVAESYLPKPWLSNPLNTIPEGAQVYPLRLRGTDDFAKLDMKGERYDRDIVWPALKEAKESGKPGIVFKNMSDWGGHQDPREMEYGADIYAVFDLPRIRSEFAQFDPRRIDENSLLASSSPPLAALSEGERDKKKSKKADKAEDKDAEAEAKAWKAFLRAVSDGSAL